MVLIIIDTLRADKLGCYGFTKETSPELDRFAAEGVQFRRVVSQCSWTRPSIASMLSSRYPRTLILYREEDEILNDRFFMLSETLRDHGYTALGVTAKPVINSAFNMDQGFATYIDSDVIFSWMQSDEGQRTARNERLASAREIFDTTLGLVADAHEFPYYIQLNIMEMHEFWRRVHHLTRPEFGSYFEGLASAAYLRALRQVSLDIDAFVKELTVLPGWQDTIFIFTSDHGQGLTDHPSVPHSESHGRLLYESQVIVPLILYHPLQKLGTGSVDQPVRLLDLAPTLLDLLGIPAPEEYQGTSLVALFREQHAVPDLPEAFVAETHFRGFDKIAVYAGDWDYIENRDGHPSLNPQELQRAQAWQDGRKTDQASKHPDVVSRLQAFLQNWEQSFPPVQATTIARELSGDVRYQLKAIGYLD